MKASQWSKGWLPTTLDRDLEPVKLSLRKTGRTAWMFLEMRDRSGRVCRMRIKANKTQARKLAYELVALWKIDVR